MTLDRFAQKNIGKCLTTIFFVNYHSWFCKTYYDFVSVKPFHIKRRSDDNEIGLFIKEMIKKYNKCKIYQECQVSLLCEMVLIG